MRILIILAVVLSASCTPLQVVKTTKTVKDLGCIVMTAEARAEIRAGQKYKTNICRDEIK